MPDETIDTNASTLVSEGATAVADAEAASSSVPVVDTNATAQDQTVESANNVNAVNPEQTVVEQATPTTTNASNNAINNVNPDQSFEQKIVAMAVNQAHNEALDANAGQSMDNFLTNEYSYNPEEVGSYWVAGGINDTKTQMSFLNAIIQEEMYDQQELGRFSYDTQIAVARAYAAQKKMETAYNYYQIAQQTAISEAALTGFYLPAEARYMLANYEKAQYTLNDPDASDDEKAKARRIAATSGRWWNANGLTDRGIKTLSMMNYEESVRHNEIMFELEKEQNEWQKSYYDASKALYNVTLREQQVTNAQSELEYGIDINGDNKLGGYGLAEYNSLEELLLARPEAYATMLNKFGTETALKNYLTNAGLESDMYDKFKYAYQTYAMAETLLENDYNIKGSDLRPTTYTAKDSNGEKKIAILPLDNGTTVVFEVEGTYSNYSDTRTYKLITDPNYELEDGSKLSDHYNVNTNDTWYSNGNKITLSGLSDTKITPDTNSDGVEYNSMSTIKINGVAVKTYEDKNGNTKVYDSNNNDISSNTIEYSGGTYTYAQAAAMEQSGGTIGTTTASQSENYTSYDDQINYNINADKYTNKSKTTIDNVWSTDTYDKYGNPIYKDKNGKLYIYRNGGLYEN